MKRLYIILVIGISVALAAVAAAILLPKLNNRIDPGKANTGTEIMDADELIMTVNGKEMDWQEYYNWLKYAKIVYENTYGEVNDWTAESGESDGKANYEALKDYTMYIISLYKALEEHAASDGVALSADERAAISDAWEYAAANYGGEEALIESVTAGYGSREMYDYFAEMSVLYSMYFEHIYGENGSKLSDADVVEYAEACGYMTVKHILFSTVDENREALPYNECSKIREKAQSVLDQIRAYDGDDIEQYFDTLVAEYSEDPGGKDGYLFTDGQMVAEFEAAAKALGEYEISDLVKSDYGYHIILRLPTDPDMVPVSAMNYGENSTMRAIAADEMFFGALEGWAQQLDVQTTDKYDNLNAAEVFAG